MPSSMTEALGIHQGDVIMRTAIVAGIADLRANPWLLDYVFKSLARDSLTLKDYGEKEIQRAKDWFLKTDIPVSMVPRLDDGAKLPRITISLADSTEAETTLGDIHYQPTEDNEMSWPAMAGPFTPERYNAATGIVVPKTNAISIRLFPGMVLVDNVGKEHPIEEVFDDGSFSIAQGTIADLSNSVIKGAKPSYVASLESVNYKETYQIGVHASGDPVYLTWLHSIIVFVLLRYKKALLEARGFERSVFSSSDFVRNEGFEPEMVFSRFINISGYVRQYWPSAVNPKITGVEFGKTDVDTAGGVRVIDGQNLPGDTDPDKSMWIGEDDILDE